MGIRKKAWLWGVVTLVPGICFVAFSTSDNVRAAVFVTQNTGEMCHYAKPIDVPNAYKRTFPNGESVAIRMEHACCTGAGFNATVLYGSDGHVFADTKRCFCGYEEMAFSLEHVPAHSLSEFLKESRLDLSKVR